MTRRKVQPQIQLYKTQNVSYIPQQHYTHCGCTIHTTACMTRRRYSHKYNYTKHIIHTIAALYTLGEYNMYHSLHDTHKGTATNTIIQNISYIPQQHYIHCGCTIHTTACMTRRKVQPQIQLYKTQNVSYIPQQHYTHCGCTIHTTACMTRRRYSHKYNYTKHRTYQVHTFIASTIHTPRVYNTYHSMHDTHKGTATNTIIQTQNVSHIPPIAALYALRVYNTYHSMHDTHKGTATNTIIQNIECIIHTIAVHYTHCGVYNTYHSLHDTHKDTAIKYNYTYIEFIIHTIAALYTLRVHNTYYSMHDTHKYKHKTYHTYHSSTIHTAGVQYIPQLA